jgi:hypothetical protein
MFESLTSGTCITTSGTTTTGVYNATPITTTLPYGIISNPPYGDIHLIDNNMNKVQNQFVAIFKIERNDKNEITSAKFIKEMWIETKNGSSVDFEVAKDSEISKYTADEISIRTIYTVTF